MHVTENQASRREVWRVVGPSSGSSWHAVVCYDYLFILACNHYYTINAVSSSGLSVDLKEYSS